MFPESSTGCKLSSMILWEDYFFYDFTLSDQKAPIIAFFKYLIEYNIHCIVLKFWKTNNGALSFFLDYEISCWAKTRLVFKTNSSTSFCSVEMYLSKDVKQSIEIKAILEKCGENGVPELNWHPVFILLGISNSKKYFSVDVRGFL